MKYIKVASFNESMEFLLDVMQDKNLRAKEAIKFQMNDSTSLNVCLRIKTKQNRKGRDKRIKISHSFKTIVAGKE